MDKIIILGHENPDVDSIVSGYLLEKILSKKGYDAKFVIPDKFISNDTMNICIKYGLEPSKFMMDFKSFAGIIKKMDDKYGERTDLKVMITRSSGRDLFCLMDNDSSVVEYFRMI